VKPDFRAIECRPFSNILKRTLADTINTAALSTFFCSLHALLHTLSHPFSHSHTLLHTLLHTVLLILLHTLFQTLLYTLFHTLTYTLPHTLPNTHASFCSHPHTPANSYTPSKPHHSTLPHTAVAVEDQATGVVSLAVYNSYVNAGGVGYGCFVILVMLLSQGVAMLAGKSC
jgi:hypothetical protein